MKNLFIKSSIAALSAILVMGVGMAVANSKPVNADTVGLQYAWERGSNGNWRYRESNGKLATGWKQIGGKWYYFFSDGYTCTGWASIDGEDYLFDSNGAMVTGWYYDTEWKCWFYFLSSGKEASGWTQIGTKWYYFDELDHRMYVGYRYIDGYFYYFGDDGAMRTGWQKFVDYSFAEPTNNWHYFKSSGKAAVGWNLINGKWYYFTEYGEMMTGLLDLSTYDSWLEEYNYDIYATDSSGAMLTNSWYHDIVSSKTDYWYYAGSNGRVLRDGWHKIDGAWYYFNEWGQMATDERIQNDDGWYYILPSGKMATNYWRYDGYDWNYYGENGKMVRGAWKQIGGSWYYFDQYGDMYQDKAYGQYYFSSSGKMVTNKWVERYGYWYYYSSNGKYVTGWQTIGGKLYYFNTDYGYMYCDTEAYIDGELYYFDSKGVLVT